MFSTQRFLAAAALVLASPLHIAALDLNGSFPGAGRGTFSLAQTQESYDEFWVGSIKVSEPMLGEIENSSTSLHMIWGLRDDLALEAGLARITSEADGPAALEESGLQDLELLLKYRFWNSKNHALVVALGGRTPLESYLADGPVSIGDGTTDFLARLIYQFESNSWAFSQQVGFDVRGDDAPDGIPLFTEVAYSLSRLELSLGYSHYIADGGTDIGQPGFTFPSTGDEYQRLRLKLFSRLTEDLGLSVCGFSTLDGRNVGEAEGFSFGLSYGF